MVYTKRFWYDDGIGHARFLLQPVLQYDLDFFTFIPGVVIEKRIDLIESLILQFVHSSVRGRIWRLEVGHLFEHGLETYIIHHPFGNALDEIGEGAWAHGKCVHDLSPNSDTQRHFGRVRILTEQSYEEVKNLLHHTGQLNAFVSAI